MGLTALGGVLTGILSGTPSSAGTFSFTVQVRDAANVTATKQLSLVINPKPAGFTSAGVVNAGSFAGDKVAPGEIVTIFGTFAGPPALVTLRVDARGYVTTELAGMRVLFDGVPSPIIYARAGQVSVAVPYSVADKTATLVQTEYQGQATGAVSLPVAPVSLGLFTADSSGKGQGAIVNQDGSINSASNPAAAGSTVLVYGTGEGQTNPAGVDGRPGDAPAPQPTAQPVTALVGGVAARVAYAGGVPGLLSGVIQFNVQIPQDSPAGSSTPIVVSLGGQPSQTGVTVAVK
jgi:uncharacterized protein (TIGR03437 family)